MEFYYMVNYLFKYVELFDTVFLALKKKPMREFGFSHASLTLGLVIVRISSRLPPFGDSFALLHST